MEIEQPIITSLNDSKLAMLPTDYMLEIIQRGHGPDPRFQFLLPRPRIMSIAKENGVVYVVDIGRPEDMGKPVCAQTGDVLGVAVLKKQVAGPDGLGHLDFQTLKGKGCSRWSYCIPLTTPGSADVFGFLGCLDAFGGLMFEQIRDWLYTICDADNGLVLWHYENAATNPLLFARATYLLQEKSLVSQEYCVDPGQCVGERMSAKRKVRGTDVSDKADRGCPLARRMHVTSGKRDQIELQHKCLADGFQEKSKNVLKISNDTSSGRNAPNCAVSLIVLLHRDDAFDVGRKLMQTKAFDIEGGRGGCVQRLVGPFLLIQNDGNGEGGCCAMEMRFNQGSSLKFAHIHEYICKKVEELNNKQVCVEEVQIMRVLRTNAKGKSSKECNDDVLFILGMMSSQVGRHAMYVANQQALGYIFGSNVNVVQNQECVDGVPHIMVVGSGPSLKEALAAVGNVLDLRVLEQKGRTHCVRTIEAETKTLKDCGVRGLEIIRSTGPLKAPGIVFKVTAGANAKDLEIGLGAIWETILRGIREDIHEKCYPLIVEGRNDGGWFEHVCDNYQTGPWHPIYRPMRQ